MEKKNKVETLADILAEDVKRNASYVMIYKFTVDEIKAIRELEETLPKSQGQEVLNDIIVQSKLDGYSQYV